MVMFKEERPEKAPESMFKKLKKDSVNKFENFFRGDKIVIVLKEINIAILLRLKMVLDDEVNRRFDD